LVAKRMIIKKSKKRRETDRVPPSPEERLGRCVQEGHRQTGLKNFLEAVRLYSIAISALESRALVTTSFGVQENPADPFNSSSSDEELASSPEKREEEHVGDQVRSQTPLYVLYGCRSQAYQGMQQFELSLEDADHSIRHNPHHALAYVQKGKVSCYHVQVTPLVTLRRPFTP
jgi:hypothetical protein